MWLTTSRGVSQERLADSDCFSRGVLLDGFPRTRAQAWKSLGSAIGELGGQFIGDMMINLKP